jgi:hypothetical protein
MGSSCAYVENIFIPLKTSERKGRRAPHPLVLLSFMDVLRFGNICQEQFSLHYRLP